MAGLQWTAFAFIGGECRSDRVRDRLICFLFQIVFNEIFELMLRGMLNFYGDYLGVFDFIIYLCNLQNK